MIETFLQWLKKIIDWFWSLFNEPDQVPSKQTEPELPPMNPKAPCPYCLVEIPVGATSSLHCEHCEHEISAIYVKEAHVGLACPIEVFGWPGHGKTVYLYALTWVLDRLALAWSDFGYTSTPATEATRRRLKDVRKAQETGKMPSPTPLGADEVYLLLLQDVPRWNRRSLMIRDCSGEAFEGFRFDTHSLKYFKGAPVTMMFVSLPDLRADASSSMDMLLVSYLESLQDQEIPEANKNLIVVLSKSDGIEGLPGDLHSYLMDDPVAELLGAVGAEPGHSRWKFNENALNSYLDGMEVASAKIKGWLLESGWGTQFVQHARRGAFSVHYCLVSSTGGPVTPGLEMVWAPKRVLDPLFWAFKISESRF